ncbi:MAG: signal peptidase I [Nocardioidaceae bacterium]
MNGHPVRHFLTTALSAALLGLVVLAGLALIVVPKATGSRPLTVLTGSMTPTYPPGTVVIVKPTDTNNLQIGDVITFQPRSGDPQLTTHRIVGVVLKGDGREYVTRGDANGADDPTPVKPAQIHGTVWYSVPYIGYLAVWVSGANIHLAIDAVAAGLVLYGGYLIAAGALEKRRRKPEVPA